MKYINCTDWKVKFLLKHIVIEQYRNTNVYEYRICITDTNMDKLQSKHKGKYTNP